jgi:hypothetical protein
MVLSSEISLRLRAQAVGIGFALKQRRRGPCPSSPSATPWHVQPAKFIGCSLVETCKLAIKKDVVFFVHFSVTVTVQVSQSLLELSTSLGMDMKKK